MIHVFMIEDNDLDVELMTMALEESGMVFTLHVATNGERGLELMKKAGQELPLPALIILDLNIPRISGLELLAHARVMPALERILIVIFSGSLNPRDPEDSLKGGANAFISKPVSIDGFLAVGKNLADMIGLGANTEYEDYARETMMAEGQCQKK